jgi:hypothetical protein
MKLIKILLVFLISAYFIYYINTYNEWHFLDSVNLTFHEAGHSIFFFLGDFFKILAGSWFQVSLPLFLSIYFYWNQQNISGSICLMWVGQNLINVSIYIADAILMRLPLLGGDSVIHDWNYLLNQFGILHLAPNVALIFYYAGIITIMTGILSAVYFAMKNYDKESSMETYL